MAETNSLINKYRPKDFSEVIGQDPVVRSLEKAIERNSAQTFLFVGPSGCGKTTLSRITASAIGIRPSEIQELDSATYNGIDDMRAITATLQYRSMGPTGMRAIILDEVHGLSKNAWQALLKILEEPPPHVYWFLCTTEEGKIPATVKTRTFRMVLKEVPRDLLMDHLSWIAEQEEIKVPDSVLRLCVSEARGSPRQAISNLSVCSACTDPEEAADLLQSAVETPEAVELARMLIKGARWREAVTLMLKMKDTNAESIRQVVRAYATTVVLTAKNDTSAENALVVLEQFAAPFPSSDGISPVVLAVGKLILLP